MRRIIRWGINGLIWVMSGLHIAIDKAANRLRWRNLAMWQRWTIRSLRWLKKINGDKN